jgi:hypothetical protein
MEADMSTLRITATLQPRIFECPNCKQTIDTAAVKCPFCSVTIDPKLAEAAADTMSKINQACSDASYLRIMASTIVVCLLLSFLPLIGFAALIGFYFLLVAVPVMTIRWWVKFGGLSSSETDWRRAKLTAVISGVVCLVFLLLVVLRFAAR